MAIAFCSTVESANEEWLFSHCVFNMMSVDNGLVSEKISIPGYIASTKNMNITQYGDRVLFGNLDGGLFLINPGDSSVKSLASSSDNRVTTGFNNYWSFYEDNSMATFVYHCKTSSVCSRGFNVTLESWVNNGYEYAGLFEHVVGKNAVALSVFLPQECLLSKESCQAPSLINDNTIEEEYVIPEKYQEGIINELSSDEAKHIMTLYFTHARVPYSRGQMRDYKRSIRKTRAKYDKEDVNVADENMAKSYWRAIHNYQEIYPID